jgi:ankyrin repeat protein
MLAFAGHLIVASALVTALPVVVPAAADGDRRVLEAAERRDLEAVRTLVKARASVAERDADGTTALHWAVHWDSGEMIDLLLEAKADANTTNDLGVFPLHLACANGSGGAVERLLAAGANPRASLASGETALMTCARTGSAAAVAALLGRGADPNARESGGQTALMWAAADKRAEVVRILVDKGADVKARSSGGFTPLLFAARSGDVDSATILADAGADVNDTAPDGGSALLVAASSVSAVSISDYRLVPRAGGHEEVALFLLGRRADPDRTDGFGMTPLHAAVETGKRRLVTALLEGGANPNPRLTKGLPFRRGDYVSRAGYAGATPFWLAAKNADVTMMRALAAGGVDPTIPSANGTTPFLVAAGVGQTDSRLPAEARILEAVTFALELGADINSTNRAGQTAVHGAANISADSVIRFLAERGAKVDARDKQGRTPVDVAQAINRPRPVTAELLRKLAAGSQN